MLGPACTAAGPCASAGVTAETVVRVYEAPGGGRLLHLVGTVHLGDAAYFEALSAVLADVADAGAAVHYERIRRADDADVTDEERDQLERVEATGYPQGLEAFVGVLGLALQGERLVLPPGARNVDVSDVELLRSLGGDRYRRLLARTDITIDERAAPLAQPMFGVLLKHGRALDRIRAVSRRQRRVNRFLIGERNRLALAGRPQGAPGPRRGPGVGHGPPPRYGAGAPAPGLPPAGRAVAAGLHALTRTRAAEPRPPSGRRTVSQQETGPGPEPGGPVAGVAQPAAFE